MNGPGERKQIFLVIHEVLKIKGDLSSKISIGGRGCEDPGVNMDGRRRLNTKRSTSRPPHTKLDLIPRQLTHHLHLDTVNLQFRIADGHFVIITGPNHLQQSPFFAFVNKNSVT